MKNLNTTNRKLRNVLASVVLFAGIFIGNAQVITFTSSNLKNALLEHDPVIDTNSDGEITVAEAEAFTGTINVANKSIGNLGGIEYFANITGLDCHNNSIGLTVDLSAHTALEFLFCSNNEIISLDVTENPALKTIWASNNLLAGIDVSNNLQLEGLSVQNNFITGELNLNANTALENLECFGNNNLTSIIAQNLNLIQLDAYNCSDLREIDCRGNELTELNLSGLPDLDTLWCSDNNLTSLDVSNNPDLETLICGRNNLTSLDVSNNLDLEYIHCYENNLTSFDISNIPALWYLNISDNGLTSLNLANGNNANISFLYTEGNDLDCIRIDEGFIPPSSGWLKDPETEYSADCALGVNDFQAKAVSVYPNPAQDKVFFESATPIQKLVIYNLSGSKVKEVNLMNDSQAEVNISALPAGVYLAEIYTKKGRETLKLIKK